MNYFVISDIMPIFAQEFKGFLWISYGSLAEWLGTGLQNRLRRFESARNLPSP